METRGGHWQGALLVLLVCAFALSFLNFKGTDDTRGWSRFIAQTQESGLVGGYRAAGASYPYPPLSFVMLDLTARAAGKIGVSERTGIKLAIYGMFLATLAAFLAYTRKWSLTGGLGIALILSSVALAYIDIFLAPFLVLALWALHREKWWLFAVLFAVACLIKWQPLVLAPFFALYFLRARSLNGLRDAPWRRVLVEAFAPAAAVGVGILAIFGWPVIASLQHALGSAPLSAQALNLNWLYNYFLNVVAPGRYGPLLNGMPNTVMVDQDIFTGLTRVVFWAAMAAVLVLWFRAEKTFENLMLFLLLGYLTYFTLGTGAHENHLFPAVLLAAVLAHVNARYVPVFVTWALAANVNLFLFYGIDGRTLPFSRMLWDFDTSVLLAAVNVALFVGYFVLVMQRQRELARSAVPEMLPAAARSAGVETGARATQSGKI
ncbi:MAG TPA: hypothetical protein VFR15_14690 [Chloroflexia bacterium]|nr:hypothetical protein [Chloroflexia bacterium]